MKKCEWCMDGGVMEKYHDEEWGVACHDDQRLFEYLMLEAMSCGLSWNLMLKKRETFRECFAGFDCEKVAAFGEDDICRALEHPGMIKSRRKIEAIVSNARCYMQIQQEFGSFDSYLWGYTGGKTYIYRRHICGEPTKQREQGQDCMDSDEAQRKQGEVQWITKNELSDRIAADLKKRGFKFLGSTLIYSYLQGVGIINDHVPDCWMFKKIGGTMV